MSGSVASVHPRHGLFDEGCGPGERDATRRQRFVRVIPIDSADHASAEFDALAREAQVELAEESRSVIAVLSTMVPGSAPKAKAAAAVKAYDEYHNL